MLWINLYTILYTPLSSELWVTYFCHCKSPTMCSTYFNSVWFTTYDIIIMIGAFVMLSGMIFSGESMQIYGDDNRSFESCQLDLETQAMKTSNENLLSWQACVHTDVLTRGYRHTHTHTHTHRLFTIPLRALRQMAFSHVKGHKWNSRCEHRFGYSTASVVESESSV